MTVEIVSNITLPLTTLSVDRGASLGMGWRVLGLEKRKREREREWRLVKRRGEENRGEDRREME